MCLKFNWKGNKESMGVISEGFGYFAHLPQTLYWDGSQMSLTNFGQAELNFFFFFFHLEKEVSSRWCLLPHWVLGFRLSCDSS